ncbi:bifunctional aspartate kinase/homoserine dehydrogenase I [Buchnera aphidicola]|uniref:bifunctional aspartate kinase/homoserine dehydrogenase I n=1 Tax=Buchnera aphidicola TaxID=9 RepID=UPI0030EF6F79
MICVMKFGGTSLSNAKNFYKVFKIIKKKNKNYTVAIVLSAPHKITNYLIQTIKQSIIKKNFKIIIKKIKKKIKKIIKNIFKIDTNIKIKKILKKSKKKFLILKNLLNKIKKNKKFSNKTYAEISSMGEYFSVLIMKNIFTAQKFNTTVLKPEKFFIITKNSSKKIINIKKSKNNFKNFKIKKNIITLMPGFIAGDKNKNKTTLGRNGSDYSASVLSVCIQAKKCEIWTDVDGVYSCDPKIIPKSKLIKKISYKNAINFSKLGAKIIHPKTIFPLKKFNIPCIVKNTFNKKCKGTKIKKISYKNKKNFFGIAINNKIKLLKIKFFSKNNFKKFSYLVLKKIKKHNISFIFKKIKKNLLKLIFIYKKKYSKIIKQKILKNKNILNFTKKSKISIKNNFALISILTKFKKNNFLIISKIYSYINFFKKKIFFNNKNIKNVFNLIVKKKNYIKTIRKIYSSIFYKKHTINVLLIGVGKIGSTLLDQIYSENKSLKNKNIKINILGILNSKKILFKKKGINLKNWKKKFKKNKKFFYFKNFIKILKKKKFLNTVVIDCTSSNTISKKYIKFLKLGLNIITSNKKANTGNFEYYKKIRYQSNKKKLKFLYETNVGGGLPIIQTLQSLQNTGDKLIKFRGILSGSLSYIFGEMEHGVKFSEAVKKAYLKGLTEPNPREDLSGIDVARKLLILSREIGCSLELKDIKIQPILPINFNASGNVEKFLQNIKKLDNFFHEKIIKSKNNKTKLKIIGEIDKNKISQVKLIKIKKKDPLYDIKDGENAFSFYTKYYQPKPLVIRGYGAGKSVTASGIFTDLLKII